MTLLILRLEGALQSWGTHSRFDSRDSGSLPTKSGVIGLIACAMGLPRGDARIPEMFNRLQMGVRVDRPGTLMVDFQTVTGERGYLFCAGGGKRVGEPTLLTPRQYLEDACFTAILAGDEALLAECAKALKLPRWQTYLGRKSCVPTRPVFENLTDEYSSIEDALKHVKPGARAEGRAMRCEMEDAQGDRVRRDVLRTSGLDYGTRRVRQLQIDFAGG